MTVINDVSETLRKMIELGVEGDAIASDSQYTVRFTLIDNTKPKKYRDPVWLHDEYVGQERSMADIGREFGISPAAVNQWLTKHNIPTRPRGNHR
tara:strand:+ start:904 stop:1188 length:285 start_codon:yes stop_codon:yes gene_type:complete